MNTSFFKTTIYTIVIATSVANCATDQVEVVVPEQKVAQISPYDQLMMRIVAARLEAENSDTVSLGKKIGVGALEVVLLTVITGGFFFGGCGMDELRKKIPGVRDCAEGAVLLPVCSLLTGLGVYFSHLLHDYFSTFFENTSYKTIVNLVEAYPTFQEAIPAEFSKKLAILSAELSQTGSLKLSESEAHTLLKGMINVCATHGSATKQAR